MQPHRELGERPETTPHRGPLLVGAGVGLVIVVMVVLHLAGVIHGH